jgi:hypothetical protein
MEAMLLLIILSSLFLTAISCLPPFAGIFLISGASIWLVIQVRDRLNQKKRLIRRRTELRARWGILIRHLNGLPLPMDTPASLYYSDQGFVLETETDQWSITTESLDRLLLATVDQLRKISDQQLCRLLRVNSKIFYALREKIRQHDNAIRRGSILMMTYYDSQDRQGIWILMTAARPVQLIRLIEASRLTGKTIFRLPPRLKKPGAAAKAVI